MLLPKNMCMWFCSWHLVCYAIVYFLHFQITILSLPILYISNPITKIGYSHFKKWQKNRMAHSSHLRRCPSLKKGRSTVLKILRRCRRHRSEPSRAYSSKQLPLSAVLVLFFILLIFLRSFSRHLASAVPPSLSCRSLFPLHRRVGSGHDVGLPRFWGQIQ